MAIVGLSVEKKPGPIPFEITGKTEGGKEHVGGELDVRKPDFRRRQLTVSKRFTNPSKAERKRSAEDQKAFDETFDRDFEPWTFKGPFAWPRQDEVSAPFGDLRLFNGKKKSQHFGADINGETGDPIYASNDGEVVMVRDCFGSGGTVLIDHGGRLFTSYFHMSAFDVKPGQRVVRGQLLGKVGSSGRVTGRAPALRSEARRALEYPESVLRLELADQLDGQLSGPSTSPGVSEEKQ